MRVLDEVLRVSRDLHVAALDRDGVAAHRRPVPVTDHCSAPRDVVKPINCGSGDRSPFDQLRLSDLLPLRDEERLLRQV